MSTTYAVIMSIVFVGLVIMMAPNIIARNKGKVLRNIVLWLIIFVGLALAYKTIGPGAGPKDAPQLETKIEGDLPSVAPLPARETPETSPDQ